MQRPNVRETLLFVSALALGWWLHTGPVHAASDPAATLGFEFSNVGPQSALTLYNPGDHTLTVYQGATTGNSHLTCSFQYRITKPGAPIERTNCQPGTLLP